MRRQRTGLLLLNAQSAECAEFRHAFHGKRMVRNRADLRHKGVWLGWSESHVEGCPEAREPPSGARNTPLCQARFSVRGARNPLIRLRFPV